MYLGVTTVWKHHNWDANYMNEEGLRISFVKGVFGTVELDSEKFVRNCCVLVAKNKKQMKEAMNSEGSVASDHECTKLTRSWRVSIFSIWSAQPHWKMWMLSCSAFVPDEVHMTRWATRLRAWKDLKQERDWWLKIRLRESYCIEFRVLWISGMSTKPLMSTLDLPWPQPRFYITQFFSWVWGEEET